MAAEPTNEYELMRERRIAQNKQKMMELGLQDAVEEMVATQQAGKAEARERRAEAKKRKREEVDFAEKRVSSRAKKEVNYNEDSFFPKAAKNERGERVVPDALKMDLATAEELRKKANGNTGGAKKPNGKKRGPVDSGKGTRVQGGRVYDSSLGVTCHWCRQKTLEDHVVCSNENCGGGKRMPTAFCKMCLRNRHGEDVAAADASGEWQCPMCRGSCGTGCITCCNCGPCRLKAGLEPTRQVKALATQAGFSNAHDYLIHLVTGESAEEISGRKAQHEWGAWMHGGVVQPKKQQQEEQAEEEGAEGAQEEEVAAEPALKRGSKARYQRKVADSGKQQAPSRGASEEPGVSQDVVPAAKAPAKAAAKWRDQDQAPAKAKGKASRRKSATPGPSPTSAAPAKGKAAAKGKDQAKVAKGKRRGSSVQAEAPAQAEAAAEQQAVEEQAAPLSAEARRLARKQRVMASLGLAVC